MISFLCSKRNTKHYKKLLDLIALSQNLLFSKVRSIIGGCRGPVYFLLQLTNHKS